MSSTPAPRASRYPRATATPSPSHYHDTSVGDLSSPPDHSTQAHEQKLADAMARHNLVRSRANDVLRLYEEEFAREQLLEQTRLNTQRLKVIEQNIQLSQEKAQLEQRRIKAEEAARLEEQRARELASKTVPPLPPVQQLAVQKPALIKPATAPTPTPQPAPSALPATTTTAIGSSFKQITTAPAAAAPAVTTVTAPATATSVPVPAADARNNRAATIHQNLKTLRRNLERQCASNAALKVVAGDLRRELRKFVGQLSLDKQANNAIMKKVTGVLKDGLANQVNSSLVEPSNFVFDDRQPVEGAANNAQLSSLFFFLVNHLAKSVIKQFINECAVNTKKADPIGVLVASIFADPQFHWRGKPLIDVLICKFHVVCPVLFGASGLEKSDQERLKIGWPRTMSENDHYDRQIGLAAGYAAISLRDFSKSKKDNPYPMHHYWEAFARIVNTGFTNLSNTQCLVLKAMIENYEQRFLLFYGDAAIAALRLALVDLPGNAKSAGIAFSGIDSLAVHAKTLKSKYGLVLA